MASLNLRRHRGVRSRRQKGIAVVEMALLLPLLLLLLFGMLEYGWMFVKVQQLGAAARRGARLGITQPATSAEVIAAVDQYMSTSGLASSGYSVTLNPANVATIPSGSLFSVTVTVPYSNITLTGFPLPAPTNLAASTSMAKEGPPP